MARGFAQTLAVFATVCVTAAEAAPDVIYCAIAMQCTATPGQAPDCKQPDWESISIRIGVPETGMATLLRQNGDLANVVFTFEEREVPKGAVLDFRYVDGSASMVMTVLPDMRFFNSVHTTDVGLAIWQSGACGPSGT